MGAGHFRQDLYYRIKGVELKVPPLRNRREDILLLANYFLDRHTTRMLTAQPAASCSTSKGDDGAGSSLHFSPEAIDALLTHAWPGNVRELEHTVTAAAAMTTSDSIRDTDLQLLPATSSSEAGHEFGLLTKIPLSEAKAQLVEKFQRTAIRAALDDHCGNISVLPANLEFIGRTCSRR